MQLNTWRKYEWTEEDWLFFGVCISVVVQTRVEDILTALSSTVNSEKCTFDVLEQIGAGARSVGGESREALGLLQVENAVVIVEPYGGVGDDEKFLANLSQGRVASSYYISGTGRGMFKWYVDGSIKCAFDHDTPGSRRGSNPDAVLPFLEAIGGFMPLDAEAAIGDDVHTTAAVMTLMEAVTGVEITYSKLRESTYTIVFITSS